MSLPASVVAFGLFLAEIRPRTAPGLPRTDSNRGICFSRKIRKRLLHLSSTTFRQDDQGVSATGRENMEYLAVCYAMFQTRSVYRVLISEFVALKTASRITMPASLRSGRSFRLPYARVRSSQWRFNYDRRRVCFFSVLIGA
jgi:hypothetical protein